MELTVSELSVVSCVFFFFSHFPHVLVSTVRLLISR